MVIIKNIHSSIGFCCKNNFFIISYSMNTNFPPFPTAVRFLWLRPTLPTYICKKITYRSKFRILSIQFRELCSCLPVYMSYWFRIASVCMIIDVRNYAERPFTISDRKWPRAYSIYIYFFQLWNQHHNYDDYKKTVKNDNNKNNRSKRYSNENNNTVIMTLITIAIVIIIIIIVLLQLMSLVLWILIRTKNNDN